MWIVFRPILWFFVHLKIAGTKNLKGIKGPIILVLNHIRFIDPIAAGSAFPFFLAIFNKIFPIRYLAQYESYCYYGGKVGKFHNFAGCLPVVTDGENKKKRELLKITLNSMEEAVTILKNNGTIAVFCEGKRGDGKQLLPFNTGVGELVAECSNATIVPIVLGGNCKITPKEFISRKCRVTVDFGKPYKFDLDLLSQLNKSQIRKNVTRDIETRFHKLYDSLKK